MTEDSQREAGIEPGLLRLSVGIEHVADLITDVAMALNCVSHAGLGIANYG